MRVLHLAYVIALGAVLGLGSAHYAVANRPAISAIAIGPWTAWPRIGGREIDPYLRAYLARGVHLPLGAGEGLDLVAERDSAGQALEGRCRYRIAGTTPVARGWTLGVFGPDGSTFRLPLARSSFTDSEIVRDESGAMRIALASSPESGNWLPLPAGGGFRLRLRLYDTPISSHANELRPGLLPSITRLDCR